MGIIKSILETDLYKITMQNAVLKLYPRAEVRFKFFNRGKTIFPKGFDQRLRDELNCMSRLKMTKSEKEFLTLKCGRYLDPAYIDYLSTYQFNPEEVKITQTGGVLDIDIEGLWYRTILWEVPLMALISELYFVMTGATPLPEEELHIINRTKIEKYNLLDVKIAEFGTRRRYSFENHDRVLNDYLKYSTNTIVGTSNVFMAYKYNITPIGTHAHEWFMFHAAKYGFHQANKEALEAWVRVYRGDLGTALSDTFTTEAFFKCFDTMFAKLFDGVRHDSGDPLAFADKVINHYKKLNINPLTKTIVFSDGLNYNEVEKITRYCRGRVLFSFGIGTDCTNDVGVKPLNIVIKMTYANPDILEWIPCIKLSDSPGKHTGLESMIQLAQNVLGIYIEEKQTENIKPKQLIKL